MIDFTDAPVFSRQESFKTALEALNDLKRESPVIVEIGCIRQVNDLGAGNSSELFTWFIGKHGGHFSTCDLEWAHCELCRSILGKNHEYENWNVTCGDGVKFLQEFNGPIDLLYLDSMDCGDGTHGFQASAAHHLDLLMAAKPKLSPKAIVAIDDNFQSDNWYGAGKGALVVPYLLWSGHIPLKLDYLTVFQMKD